MIFWFFLYLILAQKKLQHQMLKNSDVQHILWSVFSDLLFFLKYFSILNTMQAGKRKALKVTIPAEARLPLQIYFFFCAFWSSQEYKEEKTHIFHFSLAGFLLGFFFIKKNMLLRTSWSLAVIPYLCFGQKNLVLNLNIWQVERFWGGSICVSNMYIRYSYQR